MTCQHSSLLFGCPSFSGSGVCGVWLRGIWTSRVDASEAQRWWGEAPELPETVRKATLLVESMVASAEAFAEPRPSVCNRRPLSAQTGFHVRFALTPECVFSRQHG